MGLCTVCTLYSVLYVVRMSSTPGISLWEWCPELKGDLDRIRYLQSRGLSFEMDLLKFFNQQELMELAAQNEAIIETLSFSASSRRK